MARLRQLSINRPSMGSQALRCIAAPEVRSVRRSVRAQRGCTACQLAWRRNQQKRIRDYRLVKKLLHFELDGGRVQRTREQKKVRSEFRSRDRKERHNCAGRVARGPYLCRLLTIP